MENTDQFISTVKPNPLQSNDGEEGHVKINNYFYSIL